MGVLAKLQLNSSTAPIQKLPCELITEIFTFLIHNELRDSRDPSHVLKAHNAQMTIASVCRTWQDLLVRISALWPSVYLQLGCREVFSYTLQLACRHLSQSTSSKKMHIVVDASSCVDLNLLVPTTAFVAKHIHRIEGFHVQDPPRILSLFREKDISGFSSEKARGKRSSHVPSFEANWVLFIVKMHRLLMEAAHLTHLHLHIPEGCPTLNIASATLLSLGITCEHHKFPNIESAPKLADLCIRLRYEERRDRRPVLHNPFVNLREQLQTVLPSLETLSIQTLHKHAVFEQDSFNSITEVAPNLAAIEMSAALFHRIVPIPDERSNPPHRAFNMRDYFDASYAPHIPPLPLVENVADGEGLLQGWLLAPADMGIHVIGGAQRLELRMLKQARCFRAIRLIGDAHVGKKDLEALVTGLGKIARHEMFKTESESSEQPKMEEGETQVDWYGSPKVRELVGSDIGVYDDLKPAESLSALLRKLRAEDAEK